MNISEKYELAYSLLGSDIDRSIALYNEVLEAAPNHNNANSDLTLAYTLIGDYVNAINQADKFEKRHFKDFRVYYCKGYINYRLQNYKESIQWYEKSLEYEVFSGSYYSIGLAFLKLKDYHKSLYYLQKSLDTEINGKYIFVLGIVNIKLKNYNKAIECFHRLSGKSKVSKLSQELLIACEDFVMFKNNEVELQKITDEVVERVI